MAYIVVARHPLDAAVSLYHQGANIDRAVLRRLVGLPEPAAPPAPRPGLHDWLVEWIEDDPAPDESFDSLPGVLWHLDGAWERRSEPNMLLVHYGDLEQDLEGEMQRIARRLVIEVDDAAWPELVEAASFEWMSARAQMLLPDPSGVLWTPGRSSAAAGREPAVRC